MGCGMSFAKRITLIQNLQMRKGLASHSCARRAADALAKLVLEEAPGAKDPLGRHGTHFAVAVICEYISFA